MRKAVHLIIAVVCVTTGRHNVLAQESVKGSDPKGFDVYRFVLDGEGKYSPKAKGLSIMVMRTWADGKAQIVMVYVAPKP